MYRHADHANRAPHLVSCQDGDEAQPHPQQSDRNSLPMSHSLPNRDNSFVVSSPSNGLPARMLFDDVDGKDSEDVKRNMQMEEDGTDKEEDDHDENGDVIVPQRLEDHHGIMSRKRPSGFDFQYHSHGLQNSATQLMAERQQEENVFKIRKLNLNDDANDKDDEDMCGDRDDERFKISSSDVRLPSSIIRTIDRKPGNGKHSDAFYISPNDVMMDPYHGLVPSHGHGGQVPEADYCVGNNENEKQMHTGIDDNGDGGDSINGAHIRKNGGGYSLGDASHEENKNALNVNRDRFDHGTRPNISPPMFDFDSDFISPPAPVKKSLIAGRGDEPFMLSRIEELGYRHGHGHGHGEDDHVPIPLECFYNHSAKSTTTAATHKTTTATATTMAKTKQRDLIYPRVPQTPMTQRKSPSGGGRFPLFQLSPQKPKHFDSFIFGRPSPPPSPNTYQSPFRRHTMTERDCYDTGVSTSRLSQDFQLIGTLGDGSFGTVYKGLSRLDGCTYAIKASKRCAKGRSDRERMLQEVKALAVLSDVSDVAAFHIVRYHQAWIEDNRLHIVTDLCTSTLHVEMTQGTIKQDTQRQYKLLREMLLALKLIHQHGKVHLDIKPENIFVKDDLFKLGDFGLVVEETTVGEVEEGDCRYMCRELISGNHRDLTKCDIFSLGITLYQVIVDQDLPADGPKWHDLRSGKLDAMVNAPTELQNIIRQMMHPDGKERPTAAELLTRRQLLSEEQKKLIAEQNKAKEAQQAWEAKLKKITPLKKVLQRSNTCPR